MSEVVVAALIGAVSSAVVAVIANLGNNQKLINAIKLEVTKNQAIIDTKIEELTREVQKHNNFAQRMPVVENEIKHIEEKIIDLHKND